MKKILEYALSTKDVKEIAGTFAVENIGSRRVMEKLGMTYPEDTEYTKFDDSETFKARLFSESFN